MLENRMEKLLNLLNQYDDEEGKDLYEWEIEGEDIIGYNRFWGGYETIDVSKSVIISKRYGFIKRLVSKEQRRIDRSKVNFENIFYEYDGDITDEERILILLSIQEEPVSFLIDLLK